MTPLPSPYNFVPVTPHIYHPPWAAQASHDVPFPDGICGSLALTVTAATPIYVRLKKDSPDFYRAYPGGPYAIPGSTLKGLIRSIVEIAAFGKLGRFVNDTQRRAKGKIEVEDIKSKLTATLPAHVAPWPPDLAETIFGFAEGDDGLRSRVSFDTLEISEPKAVEAQREVGLLTSAGRCAPLYLVPGGPYDAKSGLVASGTLPRFDDVDSLLRGWKRYAARDGLAMRPPGMPKNKFTSALCPLPVGTGFSGCVRIHNLRPVELGAVLWALTWGGNPGLRHSLGLAKPYGYGGVQVDVGDTSQLRSVDGAIVDLADCQREFVRTMESFMVASSGVGWAGCDSLRQLLALADPSHRPPMETRYATASELEAAKKSAQTLLPYAPPASVPLTVQGEPVPCVVLERTSKSGAPFVRTVGDMTGRTDGPLNIVPKPMPAVGSVAHCIVTSDKPGSYAYKYVSPA